MCRNFYVCKPTHRRWESNHLRVRKYYTLLAKKYRWWLGAGATIKAELRLGKFSVHLWRIWARHPPPPPPRPHGAIFNYNVLNFLATYRLCGSHESSYPIRGKYSIGQCHDSAPLATLHHNHYRPQAKLGQGNISRGICHSVHREGKGGLSTGGLPTGCLLPWRSVSRGVCIQRILHPGWLADTSPPPNQKSGGYESYWNALLL